MCTSVSRCRRRYAGQTGHQDIRTGVRPKQAKQHNISPYKKQHAARRKDEVHTFSITLYKEYYHISIHQKQGSVFKDKTQDRAINQLPKCWLMCLASTTVMQASKRICFLHSGSIKSVWQSCRFSQFISTEKNNTDVVPG
mgnify:FL=1